MCNRYIARAICRSVLCEKYLSQCPLIVVQREMSARVDIFHRVALSNRDFYISNSDERERGRKIVASVRLDVVAKETMGSQPQKGACRALVGYGS